MGSSKRRAIYYGINVIVLATLIVGMAYVLIRLNATPSITNNPPFKPSAPSGFTSGSAGSAYTYTILGTDPDGDQVKYTFDWGDGTTTDTIYVDSGASASVSHSWITPGTYTVMVRTTDNNGATSSWSAVLTVAIASVSNNPPATPSVPSGSTSGTAGTSYTYSASASDSDGDQIKYTFDWGDGTTTDTSFVASGVSGSAPHSWSSAGTYSVKARATDNNGATSSWGTALTVTITTAVTSNPPAAPSVPSGSTSGTTGTFYTYSTSATDPDGDQVKYTFDWGDNTTTENSFVASGVSSSAQHSWSSAGTYSVKAKTTDNNGATSSWSSALTVTITAPVTNNPPATPSTPSGTTSGSTSTSYSYSTSATDPDGNQVKYTFDWGDNTSTTDTAFVNSGTSASASHSWSSAGTYSVKARATDNNGATSSWSTALTVTITGGGTDTSKYGFETSTMGWKNQTWVDSQAITAVTQTTTKAKLGLGSIQCTVNLIGGDANKGKGEAYVEDMRVPASKPNGATAPVNLSAATVTVWVYLPAAAVGDISKPNGIQLFFKDSSWKSAYSTWYNIGTDLPTDTWSQVTVNIATESWPYTENPDFTNIVQVGVKIGAGTDSVATFSGNIWIDAFNW